MSLLTPAALLAIALSPPAQAQDAPSVIPAPASVDAQEADKEAAVERDPLDGEIINTPIHGTRVEATALGAPRIQNMTEVAERAKNEETSTELNRQRNGQQGTWHVATRKFKSYPHSGKKSVLNRWGDTSMGIGFGETVTVNDLWISSQGGRGIWAKAIRVIGFRDGQEVSRTDWFEDVDQDPSAMEVELSNVDRIVIEAKPSASGAGFYAMDDLRFTAADGTETIVDFEDSNFDQKLTGTDFAGLTWEEGTGSFTPPAPTIVPAPQTVNQSGNQSTRVQGALSLDPSTTAQTASSSQLGGGGTIPDQILEFRGPRLGDNGANAIPPDTAGAVGLNHFVAVVNSNLSIYEKDTGNRVLSTSLGSFFGGGVGDPRIVYDFNDNRWCMLATDFGDLIYLAYSETDDPTGNWFTQSIRLTLPSTTNGFVDFPTLGVDSRGIFVGAFIVNANSLAIFAIDKAPLLQLPQSLGTVTAFRNLLFDGAIQHANQYTDAGMSYMISRRTSTSLRLRTINEPLSNPTLTTQAIFGAANFSNPPDAPAMGSSVNIDTGDTRIVNACYIDGSIWASHTINVGGRAGARWYEVNPVNQTILQSGTVSDPSLAYYYPSIAADAQGNVVMGFSGSDASTFPSAYYTGRLGTDPAGEMAPPVLYSAGAGAYTVTDGFGRNRWGDYSLTTLDPVDGSFWTIQERSRAIGNSWVTRIVHLDFNTCDGTVTRYCAALPNPSGMPARMEVSGSTSLSANDLVLSTTNLPANSFGFYIYGDIQASTPVGDGILCVTNPLFRLPVTQGSPAGVASFALDVNNLPPGAPSFQVGQTSNFSFWYRQVSPAGFNFSDALNVQFCQ
jgi:hypothetical protein